MKLIPLSVLALGFSAHAFGSLVLTSTTPTFDVTGTGLGAVNTVLTIQSPGSSSNESGCVAPSGAGTVASTSGGCTGFTNNTVLTGASQIGTPTLGAVGIAAANEIGIVLNASEPGGAANSLTVNNVALTLYGSGGTSQTFTCAASGTGDCTDVVLAQTLSGTGASGFLFVLDSAQALQAQTFITTNGGFSTVRAGVGASLSNATGGNETFYLVRQQDGSDEPSAVPEPTTSALLGGGLLALGLFRRRKQS
jgi:hypothetical protein